MPWRPAPASAAIPAPTGRLAGRAPRRGSPALARPPMRPLRRVAPPGQAAQQRRQRRGAERPGREHGVAFGDIARRCASSAATAASAMPGAAPAWRPRPAARPGRADLAAQPGAGGALVGVGRVLRRRPARPADHGPQSPGITPARGAAGGRRPSPPAPPCPPDRRAAAPALAHQHRLRLVARRDGPAAGPPARPPGTPRSTRRSGRCGPARRGRARARSCRVQDPRGHAAREQGCRARAASAADPGRRPWSTMNADRVAPTLGQHGEGQAVRPAGHGDGDPACGVPRAEPAMAAAKSAA